MRELAYRLIIILKILMLLALKKGNKIAVVSELVARKFISPIDFVEICLLFIAKKIK